MAEIQKIQNIVLYSHGAVPTKVIADAVASFGKKMPCRNAYHFEASGVENGFTRVIVDEGAYTDKIVEAYEAAGAKVEVLKAGKAAKVEAENDEDKAPFNPDEPAKKARGKAQG
jgi:hypothetical protein